ncbi:hypothetical protein PAP_05435 [Palaeococcus pacificus DY20341]|uniref:GINS subunit domain-containing protein n=1 Tax=Palaeococcus pacificus DY20341 TaxID=1343739 RepID=A0A075LRV4_9EURY|nr:Gins 23 protein [Palaeococcus pacificus]AIF69490.1 hypothetical protein PAP_05435 [Palaeococcus pacificus DY20341]
MFVGRAVIPVKVMRPFGDWKPGDMVLIEDWKAKELWESGVVEIIDEVEKIIIELDRYIKEERENRPLATIDGSLYDRTEFYMYFLNKVLENPSGYPPETLRSYITKLANLKEKYKELKRLRFNKILKSVMLRPNSLEILNKLTPKEKELYLQMSNMRTSWLGEE